jgi:iron complex outermembrane recepter protein
MTRSRRRKLAREQAFGCRRLVRSGIPVASALLAAVPVVYADQASPGAQPSEQTSGGLQEVVVTAQKRVENLQNVPVSIQVLDSQKLDELGIVSLDDYVKYAASVEEQRSVGSSEGGNAEPGSSHTFIRGVVSGGDGNHSGSQPTVGTYIDEIPLTTIDGTVDMHMYDMQRVEILEGPQGTLFGASSESGTIRLITNKPDATQFSAGYDVKGDKIDGGGSGYEAQGFVNIPLASWAAVRLVGWIEEDPGYINNVQGTDANACIINGVRTFPTWAGQPAGSWSLSTGLGTVAPCPTPTIIGAGSITNAPWASNDYNTAIYRGGRAALKLDLNDHWTVTPGLVAQDLTTKGFFGYDPAMGGDLDLAHFGPESTQDSWYLTSLTVEGKYNGLDIVDASGYFKRTSHTIADYSDYSEFYDRAYGSGACWLGNSPKGAPPPSLCSGVNPIMPQEYVIGGGDYEKWSNEFRISTPEDQPLRATFGVFIERQLHNIWQNYTMPGYDPVSIYGGNGGGAGPNCCGFANYFSIPNFGNTIWLTDEQRVDRDKAAFIQATWDITKEWSLTGGYRYYHYDNSLLGFFGYSSNYFGNGCFPGAAGLPTTQFAPCTDLNSSVSASGSVPKATLTYKPTADALMYFTYSKGFRPGGVNRVGGPDHPTYAPDYLENYELGWKTQWLDHRLRYNGDLFWENWKNFQFSFLVPPSITAIANGGNAVIKGWENELQWLPTDRLMLSANAAFIDGRLTQNYCGIIGVTSCPTLQTYYAFDFPGAVKQPGGEYMWVGPQAPSGTQLPVAPKFKANVVARYTLAPIDNWSPYWQAAYVYQTQTSTTVIVPTSNVIGMQPAWGMLDMTAGAEKDKFTVQFLVSNVTNKLAELSRFNATNPQVDNQIYIAPAQPRTFAIEFSQKF